MIRFNLKEIYYDRNYSDEFSQNELFFNYQPLYPIREAYMHIYLGSSLLIRLKYKRRYFEQLVVKVFRWNRRL